jgi:peptidase E
MKLLLTSNGLSNHSIAESLFELVGKTPEETTIVFIPTASNIEIGDKCWFINDLINLKKYNFHSIEITDISAVGEEIWRPSLERADVLFFE